MAYLEFTDVVGSGPKSVLYAVPIEKGGQIVSETVRVPAKLIRDQRRVGELHFVYVPTWWLRKYLLPSFEQKGWTLNWLQTQQVEKMRAPTIAGLVGQVTTDGYLLALAQ